MIELHNIKKIYDDDGTVTHALRGVSLKIKKGEFVSIMGPSGSGKSTLLHILSFMDRPSKGEYIFNGQNVELLSDDEFASLRNKDMGFVFQSFNLLGRSSVYENVEMPLLYSEEKLTVATRKKMVEEAIDSVGLNDKTYSEASKLSGGQKQRVAIARALVNDPDIIFADEPTGNLDSKSGAQVIEILDKLHKSGRTIVLVTHETSTAEFAARLIKIKDGQVEDDRAINSRRSTTENYLK